MKHLPLTWFLVLSLGGWAAAAPQKVYVNDTLLTTRTNIDAAVLINAGTIFYDTIASSSVDSELFQTRDTLYVTNTGTMFVQPGFIFSTHTATGGHAANSFNNSGTITALDAPPVAFWAMNYPPWPVPSQPPGTGGVLTFTGTTVPYLVNSGSGTNLPVPSAIVVSSSNIVNSGTISAGDLGYEQFDGANIDFTGGGLAAGTISETDTNATSARGIAAGYYEGGTLCAFYSPPPVTYDICWAMDNGSSYQYDVEDAADSLYYLSSGLINEVLTPGFPIIGISTAGVVQGDTRNETLGGVPLINTGTDPMEFFPISSPVSLTPVTPAPVTPVWSLYAYYYTNLLAGTGTNIITNYYYNIICINTAFADPDITAQVQFYGENLLNIETVPLTGGLNTITNGSPYAMEGMIRFSAPMTDVLTGAPVTNSIYFLDTSAIQAPTFYATNTVYEYQGYAKPVGFEITPNQPVEWTYQIPANVFVFDPLSLENYVNITAVMTNSFYIAQVGRNPEVPHGLDPYTAAILGTAQAGMPSITNEPGRIDINASKTLVLSNMMMRGNGFVTIHAPTVLGMPAATDFGNWNVDLGNLKTPLLISNLFPASFHRLRGDLAAYTADWVNAVTNDGFGNTISNYTFYHMLILDQDLRDTFQPTGLNLALRGSSVELDDNARVMGTALIQATNLTINSNLVLLANAGALHTGNVPLMKNLLVGSGGSILVDNNINLGLVSSASPASITKANTPILTITNRGLIGSGETEFQSQIFAQGGTMIATNGGSLAINAITNYLGAGVLGLPNSLAADTAITLTSTSIQITNSTLMAGQGGNGRLILNASAELTDHLPNTASTSAYTTNLWQVTGGFSLPAKPARGDLFGTQITTIASNSYQTVVHVWAGQDLGPTVAGFFNNEVIGHLVLDRTTNATLRFSAAGKNKAMYVDYLELRDLAFSDYHHGLVVDPNFTIYFANANVDPAKLQKVYTNIVWVPQFAGPNSTVDIEYPGGSNCLMNAALAASSSVDSDHDGIPNLDDPNPLDNPGVGPIPCPSLVGSTETLMVTNGVSGQVFVIWTTGQGFVTPNLSQAGVKVGQTLMLTAAPAAGWLFGGWSGPAVAGQPASVTSSLTIKSVIPTNAFSFLTANFITNPFIGLAGAQFNGLFSVPGGVAAGDSGFVTFTLRPNGVFSGNLRFGTTSYPFSSQFNTALFATASATNGGNKLAVTLQLDPSAQPGQATGSVSNAKFNADLLAYRQPGWTAANPAPQAGSYTLVLPGNTNGAASPGGDSYGTVKVDASGNLTAVGTLADNVSFSQSVPLSSDGQWPLYFAPSGVSQPLLGWVAFDTNGAGGRPAGFGGTVTWIKAAGSGNFYPNGFSNSSVLLGSLYSAAYQKTSGLALTSPTLTLSGGNLRAGVTAKVNASGLETYQTTNKNPTLTINPATGIFSGQYIEPVTGRKFSLAGAVLQNNRVAGGFFLGTNQSGSVWLQGN